MQKFSDLGLAPAIAKALEKAGYDTPTPVQGEAVPAAIAGRGVVSTHRSRFAIAPGLIVHNTIRPFSYS